MYNSGFRSNKKTPDGVGTVAAQAAFVQKSDPSPTILSWSIQGSDDRALDPAGGQTVVVNGAGFTTGMTVSVGTTSIGSVTIVNSSQATFTAPAKAAGNYTLTMANSNGQAAILVPGLAYSTVVTWSTAAGSIGDTVETTAFTESVVATADSSITYTLASGSLPTGATLNANGVITGTAAVTASPTTYSFSVTATDAELQDSTQSFTLTVSPDVVTWVSPANGTSYTVTGNQPIANVTLSATSGAGSGITYAANALPTGLSLTGNVISGTPTVQQTVSTLLTATANTTTRSATETISWTVNLGDTYWPYVSMLLNGSTPTTTFINDASLNNAQLTIAGDTKPNNFSPYENGYYSNYFDGTGDYLVMSPNTAYNFGTGDFTVEFWINSTDTAATIAGQLSAGGTNWCILVTSGNLYWQNAYQASSLLYFAYAFTGSWTHIAFVRSSGTLTCYINGVVAGSVADNTNYAGTGSLYIGAGGYGDFQGSLSNFRIVKGTAVYTSTFTPPTAPLTAITGTSLLTCQSSRFIDNSSNAVTITVSGNTTVSSSVPFAPNNNYIAYGSAYFDGSGDYLTSSIGAPFGTGNFTIELWCYLPATGFVNGGALIQTTTAASGGTMQILLRPENNVYWRVYTGAGNINYDTPTPPVTDQWIHHAIVRSSGVTKYYFNGVEKGSIADTTNYTGTFCNIGNYAGTSPLGYIADVRIVQGTAVYTTAFTPPTAPLTAITNTQLLTCQYNGGANNNGFVDQSSYNNIITRNGNATQGTFSPYSQTGWSNYFGTGTNYFTINTGTVTIGSSTDYTIEAWIYVPALTGNLQFIVDNSSNGVGFYLTATNYLYWNKSNVGGGNTSTSAVPLNTWTHVSVCRAAGTVRFFINGVGAGSWSDTTSFSSTGASPGTAGGSYLFKGYMSNLRMLVGTGLYTSAFTPPTTPLAPIANTVYLTCQSNRIIDNGPKNGAITINGTVSTQAYSPFGGITSVPTSYSNYFDGTGDWLTAPDNASLDLGSSDFTIEGWFYQTGNLSTSSGGTGLVTKWTDAGNQRGWQFSVRNAAGTMTFYYSTTGSNYPVVTFNSVGLTLNTWTHLALVRTSNTLNLYKDGSLAGTSAFSSTIYDNTSPLAIGAWFGGTAGVPDTAAGNSLFQGYVSNVRVVKGVAVYTGAFTPPTSPLTATQSSGTNISAITGTQTSLLTCQSSTMVDNSPNYFAITANGDTKPKPFNPFGNTNTLLVSYTPSVNGGSMYFDGNGDYLSFASSYLPTVAGVAFTLEFWIYPTRAFSTDTGIISSGNIELNLVATNGQIRFDLPAGVTNVLNSGTSYPALNAWNHIAITRTSSNAYTLYLNGINVGTGTSATAITTLTTFGYKASNSLQGYISDLRTTFGAVLYTSNFYPGASPATPTQTVGATTYSSNLLVNGTSGGIIDYHSSNDLETVGNTQLSPQDPYGGSYYSNYFDDNTSYLLTGSSSNFIPSSGDFTIEAWIYPQDVSIQFQGIFSVGTYTGGILFRQSYSSLQVYISNATPAFNPGGTPLSNGSWYHVAVTRSGTNLRVFVNGTQLSTTVTNNTTISPSSNTIYVGASSHNTTEGYKGNISNLRYIVGTALYTSNFTPPTSPLTAVSGTQLLTCQSNKFVDNSTNAISITATGTPSVRSQNPFQQNTGKSLYFDGTGDYLLLSQNTNYTLGTGDFTIECWAYFNSVSSGGEIIDFRPTSTNGLYPALYVETTGVLYYYVSSANRITGATIAAGQWYYITLARSSGVTKLFVNGTQSGSNYSDTNNYIVGAGRPVIGSSGVTLGTYPLNGYIKDLRITKGIARYTTTFTPPTTPDQTR